MNKFLVGVFVCGGILVALALAAKVAGTHWAIAYALAACIVAALLSRKRGNGVGH